MGRRLVRWKAVVILLVVLGIIFYVVMAQSRQRLDALSTRNEQLQQQYLQQNTLQLEKKQLQEKAGRGLFVALLLFVGIPLPGTGAWTGTLAASLLDMDFKSSVRACMGGVLLAGCIMGALSVLGVSAFGAVMA